MMVMVPCTELKGILLYRRGACEGYGSSSANDTKREPQRATMEHHSTFNIIAGNALLVARGAQYVDHT